MAIKENQNGRPWNKWPRGLKLREKKALDSFRAQFNHEILKHAFRQFLFFQQWKSLKDFAGQKGVKIIGDIPIFIAFDSADAWANPDLFYFDNTGEPTVVAGVPPDYFSPTGQLWGNPLYRWDQHENSGYAWWINRIRAALKQMDYIRIDHFRGFVDYWEIPAQMPTAEVGEWKPGPGRKFFKALEQTFGDLPLIAEDLGLINPEVYKLRDELSLPGMKILQFGFSGDPHNLFLPHNYPENCVAYTGTHDNDTTVGWYHQAQENETDFCRRYLGCTGADISWDMIRTIWSSVAVFAIAPLQDFLRKDTHARMNFPGKPQGNWQWRILPGEITNTLMNDVKELNFIYGREIER